MGPWTASLIQNLKCAYANQRGYDIRWFPPILLLLVAGGAVTFRLMADMQIVLPVQAVAPVKSISNNIGATIRNYRLGKGMSQGDIEKRTGLLRCYLSRVENGHTVPSLETLQKIAAALDLQLSEFFADDQISREVAALNLTEDEIKFLTQVQRYSAHLSESDRRLLLAMVRKFASTAVS